jgi:hypothetical protein
MGGMLKIKAEGRGRRKNKVGRRKRSDGKRVER